MLATVTVTSAAGGSGMGPGTSRGRAAARGASGRAAPRICPYVVADDGAWRSARPERDQRCSAVEPPALLSLDKQRRVCLSRAHTACATRIAAAARIESVDQLGHDVPDDSMPATTTVTRWSIVRTAPVVLDGGRVSDTVHRPRPRVLEAGLGALMALALGAFVLARLPEPAPAGAPAVLAATGEPGPASIAALPVASRPPARGPQADPATPTPAARPQPGVDVSVPSASRISAEPSASSYRVRPGDTLYAIAARFDTTVEAIQRANELGDGTLIHVGQALQLP